MLYDDNSEDVFQPTEAWHAVPETVMQYDEMPPDISGSMDFSWQDEQMEFDEPEPEDDKLRHVDAVFSLPVFQNAKNHIRFFKNLFEA